MALAQRVAVGTSVRSALTLIGIVGACLFFGDGIITPAISVLSAVEGLEVSAPELKEYVLPISIVIIVLLFSVQWRGTGSVGRIFGPVMAAWFLSIGLLGIWGIVQNPMVLLALSPSYAVDFVSATDCWRSSCSVQSCCASPAPRRCMPTWVISAPSRSGGLAVLRAPCLVLNYFGQGALIMTDPCTAVNPFFLLGPRWTGLPMVVLATVATVIASQAIISGAFSMARQCIQLGFLPRMTVRHTSTTGGRPDLPAAGQRHAGHRRADPGAGIQDLRQSCLGVRHRRHRHVPLHQRAGDGGVPPAVQLVAASALSLCSAVSS